MNLDVVWRRYEDFWILMLHGANLFAVLPTAQALPSCRPAGMLRKRAGREVQKGLQPLDSEFLSNAARLSAANLPSAQALSMLVTDNYC